MTDLATTIAECLAAHAEALDTFGTDRPELSKPCQLRLRDKMIRQRQKVDVSLSGADPEVHAAHIAALTKGLRLVMRKLSPCS
jgi:hypothetical protein